MHNLSRSHLLGAWNWSQESCKFCSNYMNVMKTLPALGVVQNAGRGFKNYQSWTDFLPGELTAGETSHCNIQIVWLIWTLKELGVAMPGLLNRLHFGFCGFHRNGQLDTVDSLCLLRTYCVNPECERAPGWSLIASSGSLAVLGMRRQQDASEVRWSGEEVASCCCSKWDMRAIDSSISSVWWRKYVVVRLAGIWFSFVVLEYFLIQYTAAVKTNRPLQKSYQVLSLQTELEWLKKSLNICKEQNSLGLTDLFQAPSKLR